MTAPRKVHVTIDQLVVDGPVDERALRAAIAAELGGTLAGESGRHVRSRSGEARAARAVAQRVQPSVPSPVGDVDP